jgi:hypothetical protein
MELTVVTKEELEKIQSMTSSFNKAKIALAEVELEKHGILRAIDSMRSEFAVNEKNLIEKYGADAVINVQTGEITKKQPTMEVAR